MQCKQDFEKGDIIRGSEKSFDGAYHPIVYLGGSVQSPIGVVITHSDNYPCNKQMEREYFQETGNWFSNERKSYIIAHKFQKLEDWGPYSKVGKLTDVGLAFVESHVKNIGSETYFDYVKKTSNGKQCSLHTDQF